MRLAAEHVPDIVITDLVMPEKEGMETIVEVRKRWPGVRVVAISGGGYMSASAYLTMASRLGAVKTLSKPFSNRELMAAVDDALAVDVPDAR
jgi:DNA-binding NarL/FixJ family response regulator